MCCVAGLPGRFDSSSLELVRCTDGFLTGLFPFFVLYHIYIYIYLYIQYVLLYIQYEFQSYKMP